VVYKIFLKIVKKIKNLYNENKWLYFNINDDFIDCLFFTKAQNYLENLIGIGIESKSLVQGLISFINEIKADILKRNKKNFKYTNFYK